MVLVWQIMDDLPNSPNFPTIQQSLHAFVLYLFIIGVCDKPEWYRDLSYVKQNNSTRTATLLCTFKACHTPNNELLSFHWTKNKQKIVTTDEHYEISHRYFNNLFYTVMLKILHTNVNDSGKYSCHLRYKESKISPLVAEEGTLNLTISSNFVYNICNVCSYIAILEFAELYMLLLG